MGKQPSTSLAVLTNEQNEELDLLRSLLLLLQRQIELDEKLAKLQLNNTTSE